MSDNTDRVLVLDTNGQAGLAVVRSLGKRGVSVTAGSNVQRSLGRLSRHSEDAFQYPEVAASPQEFVTDLIEFLESRDYFAVVPVADVTTIVMSKHKAEIEQTGTTVAAADWELSEQVWDKGRLFALAETLSVPAPKTIAPSSVSEVAATASELSYPALVKPRSKITWDDDGQYHRVEVDDTLYADTPDELVANYRDMLDRNPFLAAEGHYPLLQEYVEGKTTTTVFLADDGEIKAHFQEERVRTYPSSGGNSTLLRPRNDDQLLANAVEVIDAVSWTGPGMVEFMETPAGEHTLIEVNGRYWGSVPFAINSGVDFPWLHYQQLRGLPIDAPASYQTERLQQRLVYGDLKWLLEQLQDGNRTAPFSVLWASLVGDVTFVSLRDPMPTLETLRQMAALAGRTATDQLTDLVSRDRLSKTEPRGETRKDL